MRLRDTLLALLVTAIWGINFTIISIGLGAFPPLLLAALRFVVAAVPALILPFPGIKRSRFLLIGLILFLGQFAFLFTGMAAGMPAGLASVVLQSQAFMTIFIAFVMLGEKPSARQTLGTLVAFAGIAAIAKTTGGADLSPAGFVLCLAAALCWAVGNVLLRGAGKVDMLAAVVWLSVIPPVPLFVLSMFIEGPTVLKNALLGMSWSGVGAILYISLLSTILGFAIWGYLLKRYPAGTVAPFSLLVPIFGATFAAVILGEEFGPSRLIGISLVFVGLLVVSLPMRRATQR